MVFAFAIEKHKAHIKHAHSMISPKISPPAEKGWADFDGFSFSSQVDKKVDDKKIRFDTGLLRYYVGSGEVREVLPDIRNQAEKSRRYSN